MSERCTDRFRKALELAEHQARQFGHEYIGTEHILLGLIEENTGVAVNVLKNLGIDIRNVTREIRLIVLPMPKIVTAHRLPQTPRARKVIEFAMEECRNLNHNYVGTEHLLLGLLRETDGVAAQVLMNLGLKLDDGRKEILNLLGHWPPRTAVRMDADAEGPKSLEEPANVEADVHQRMNEMFGPGQTDLLIRQAIQHCWLGALKERRSVAEVEAQFRRLVERALRDFHEDYHEFGPGGSAEPKQL